MSVVVVVGFWVILKFGMHARKCRETQKENFMSLQCLWSFSKTFHSKPVNCPLCVLSFFSWTTQKSSQGKKKNRKQTLLTIKVVSQVSSVTILEKRGKREWVKNKHPRFKNSKDKKWRIIAIIREGHLIFKYVPNCHVLINYIGITVTYYIN